jgi:hypothetical protein
VAQDKKGGAAPQEFILSVEKIMLAKGWKKAAVLQHRWFDGPENQLAGLPADGKGTKGRLSIDDKTITMEWLLSFSRAQSTYNELLSVYANDAAKKVLKGRLEQEFARTKARTITFGDFSKTGLALLAQESNFRSVEYGYYSASNPLQLDELDAALGRFSMYVVPKGTATKTPEGIDVTVSEVGVFAFDSYDFNGDQDLGWWKAPDKISALKPLFEPGYTNVTNKDYQEYRKRHKRGGDFLIFSDVKVKPVKDRFVLK